MMLIKYRGQGNEFIEIIIIKYTSDLCQRIWSRGLQPWVETESSKHGHVFSNCSQQGEYRNEITLPPCHEEIDPFDKSLHVWMAIEAASFSRKKTVGNQNESKLQLSTSYPITKHQGGGYSVIMNISMEFSYILPNCC